MMGLYDRLSQGEVPANRQPLLEQLAAVITERIYNSDINSVYTHSLGIRTEEDIELDLSIYGHRYSPLLNKENKDTLIQRISSHASIEQLLDLMRMGIKRNTEEARMEKIFATMQEAAHKNGHDIIQVADLTTTHWNAVYTELKRNVRVELHRFCVLLQSEQFSMSPEAKQSILSFLEKKYHQSKDLFFPHIFSSDLLLNGTSTDWAADVDMWEEVLSKQVDGGEFYRSVVEKELEGTLELYDSILDMITSKTFSEEHKNLILSNIVNIRIEWGELQRQKKLGVADLDGRILGLETKWGHTLRLIPALNAGVNELVYLLSSQDYAIPIALQEKALSFYLEIQEGQLDQDLLQVVFVREKSLQNTVIPYLTLSTLQELVLQCMNWTQFKELFRNWKTQVGECLEENACNVDQWRQLADVGDALPADSILHTLHAKITTNASDLGAYWSEKTATAEGRAAILEELIDVISLQVLRSLPGINAMHMALFFDGRPLARAIVRLNTEAEQRFSEAKQSQKTEKELFEASASEAERKDKEWPEIALERGYDLDICRVLAYSKDSFVQQVIQPFVPVSSRKNIQKHISWIDNLEKSRTSRFLQELS